MKRTLPWIAAAILAPITAAQDNWPQWRGPTLNGVSPSTGLPLTWSLEENIVWKTELPSWSGATPIIWGDRIFITSPSKLDPEEAKRREEERQKAAEERQRRRGGGNRRGRGGRGGGRRRGFGRGGASDPGGEDLLLLCLSKSTGKIMWQKKLDQGNKLHRKGNNASPSPITDGEHVWTVTGNGVITAFDMDGEEVWKRNLQDDYGAFGHNWGYASTPVLDDGKLFVEVLHGMRTDDPSYVVGLDAATGEVLWRQERPTDAVMESPDAYTTPTVLRVGGKKQIVVTGGDYVTAHSPDTGKELWRVAGLNPGKARNYRIVASPVAIDGMVYAPTRVRPLLAVKVGDDGKADQSSVAWKWDARGGPDVPTPICDGERFFMVNDQGMVTCIDAKSGETLWGPERSIDGTISSSPFLAEGRLYFTNEQGVTAVVSAGDDFDLLASNELDGTYTLSSPVPSGNRIYIRTSTHLYCIGNEE